MAESLRDKLENWRHKHAQIYLGRYVSALMDSIGAPGRPDGFGDVRLVLPRRGVEVKSGNMQQWLHDTFFPVGDRELAEHVGHELGELGLRVLAYNACNPLMRYSGADTRIGMYFELNPPKVEGGEGYVATWKDALPVPGETYYPPGWDYVDDTNVVGPAKAQDD